MEIRSPIWGFDKTSRPNVYVRSTKIIKMLHKKKYMENCNSDGDIRGSKKRLLKGNTQVKQTIKYEDEKKKGWETMGFNVSRLFYSRPQTLGEGMRRVVCKAGGTKTAHLRKVAQDYSSAAREYTNGVTIYHDVFGTSVLNPRGNLVATIDSGMNKLKGFWRKCSGWINGKQKYSTAQIDINGKLVDRYTDKGKNILRNYTGNIHGDNCEKMALEHGSYAKEAASKLLNKTV